MTFRISTPTNALEQKAMDARLQELGLTVDPRSRQITDEALSRSSVRGKSHALKQVLGDRSELELDDLQRLGRSFGLGVVGRGVAGVFGRDRPSVARATIQSAAMTMKGTAQQLSRFAEGSHHSYAAIASMFRRLENLESVLSSVSAPEVIGHANRSDINTLRGAYSDLLGAFGRHEPRIRSLVYDQIIPQLKEDHALNQKIWNAVAEGGGARIDAMVELRTHGVPQKTIDLVIGYLERFPRMVDDLVAQSWLFAGPASTERASAAPAPTRAS